MRIFLIFLLIFSGKNLLAQFTCNGVSYNLTSTELGAITNNTLSYTYNASTFNMPYTIQVAKVAGNGPRLYRYTSTSGVWIGKDDDDESIQPPIQEYVDVVITFSGDVSSVYLDFQAINNNSDGEEQIQSIFPQTSSGSNITTGVSYFYEPGVPSGTIGGTFFRNSTKTIHANSGNGDNGRLHISSTTPFRKIRFRWKELSDLSFSGPNGIVLNRIQYCPLMPEIECLYQNQILATSDTVFGPTLFPNDDSLLNFTIRNRGNDNLSLQNIRLNGSSAFQLQSPANIIIPAGGTYILPILFQPQNLGLHQTLLQFQSNDISEPNYAIQINSNCIGPNLQVSNSGNILSNGMALSSAPTVIGLSDTLDIVVENLGNDTLRIDQIIFPSNIDWSVLNSSPTFLLQGQKDSFQVIFHPNNVGLSTFLTQIISNDGLNDTFNILFQGISLQPIIINQSICQQQIPFIWNGQALSLSGNYFHLSTNSIGLDSLTQLNLTVLPADTSREYRSVCSNQLPYIWNQNSISNSGIYQTVLSNIHNCDSMVILNLTIDSVRHVTIKDTICENLLPYTWQNYSFFQSGLYADTLNTISGCDSIIQLELYVIPTISDTQFVSICSQALPFIWNQIPLSQSGSYSFIHATSSGCDSISILNLQVNFEDSIYFTRRICQNQLPYQWNGLSFTQPGSQTSQYANQWGCDSLVTFILEVDSVFNHIETRTICQDQLPYLWNGLLFMSSGNQTVQYNSVSLCDSIVNYQLNVLPVTSSQQSIVVSSLSLPYIWNGINITQSGIYNAGFIGTNGCDSIAELNLTVNQASPPQIEVSYSNNIISSLQTISLPNLVLNQIYDFSFYIKNLGLSPLSIAQIIDNHSNVVVQSNIQNGIQNLNTDSFRLQISPMQLGNQTVSIKIFSNDPTFPIFEYNIAFKVINGPSPEIELSYQQIRVPNQDTISLISQPVIVGQTQYIQLVVQNIGNSTLSLNQLLSNNTQVQIDSNYTRSLAPYAQTFILLSYSPMVAGLDQMTLTILNNDADESLTQVYFKLKSIIITAAEIDVLISNQQKPNLSSFNIGSTSAGTLVQNNLQIRNSGNAILNINSIRLSSGRSFNLVGSTANINISAGSFINVGLNFSAQTAGTSNDTLIITSNDSDENPYRIRLQGTVLSRILPNCSNCYALNVVSNPIDDAEWIDNKPRLTWQHEEGLNIYSYNVELWESTSNGWLARSVNGNLVNQVLPTNSSTVVFQVNSGLTYFKKHRWKVTAYDANNLPISCFVREFLVQKAPQVPAWNCSHPNVPNFGSELGQFNNVPIYKNGGCVNGVYDANTNTIATQYYNSNFAVNPYGWQCAELPPRYYKTRFKISAGPGNGVDYHNISGNRKGFRRFENGISTVPPTTDDILSRNSYSHQFGHVVIAKGGPVNSNATSSFRIIQQNYGSNLTAHTNGSLPIKRQNGKYTITDRNSGVWLSWIRAKPEIIVPGNSNNIPVVNSTTPDFKWAKHSNIKGYQFKLYRLSGNCYQLEHDIRIRGNNFSSFNIPALIPGETYKWNVENIYHVPNNTGNWNKKIKSYSHYFTVANQATANRTLIPLLAEGASEQNLWIQSVGSPLYGTEIWFKNDEEWLFTAATEDESSVIVNSNYFLPADSLMFKRKGYYDTKFELSNSLLNRGKYYIPMFPKSAEVIKIEVSLDGNHLFTNSTDVKLIFKGEGYTSFQLYYEDVLHDEVYSFEDSVVILPYLEPGYQSVRVYAYNSNDTLAIDKHFMVTEDEVENMSVSFALEDDELIDIYLDNQFFARINSSSQFTIPKSNYNVSIKGYGLENSFYEIESDTVLNVNLNKNQWLFLNQTISLNPQEPAFVDLYLSLLNDQGNQIQISSDSSFMRDSIYEALSETIHFSRNNNQNNDLTAVKWIIDKQLPNDALFLRWVEANDIRFMPIDNLGNDSYFDKKFQLLSLKALKNDFSCTLVRKKQQQNLDSNSNQLYIFPNPNQGTFTLYIPEIEGSAQVELYDILGRNLYSSKQLDWVNHSMQIQIEDLNPGNYIIRVISGEQWYSSKLTISK